MRRFLRAKGVLRNLLAVTALMVIGVIVAVYLLEQQRMRLPFREPAPLRLQAELSTAQAVTPGQGQTVRVAGVRIGDIGRVRHHQGRAIVELVVDRRYDDVIRTNARALLRPKTGLKDMFLEVDPGTEDAPVAEEGWTMPVGNTLPDVNPDEILSMLDADVRDHVRVLLANASAGLKGRDEDLREVLKRFEPTHRALARVNGAVKQRRRELRRLVSSLAAVNTELARRDDDLAELVGQSSRTFRAMASRQADLSALIRELPSALRTTRLALDEADRLAQVIEPSTTRLQGVPGALQAANRAVTPFAREAAPLLRADIRPFVRQARPVVRDLRPAVRDLATAEPAITRSFEVLNGFFNMLAHNPNGREGPEVRDRDEGFLFFLGWLGHQSTNIFSGADAHGVFRPVVISAPCSILLATAQSNPPLSEITFGLSGVLADERVCGGDLLRAQGRSR